MVETQHAASPPCCVGELNGLILPSKGSAALFAARLRIARWCNPGWMFVPSPSPAFSRTVEIVFPVEIDSVVPQMTRDSNRRHSHARSFTPGYFQDAPQRTRHCSRTTGSFFAGGCLDSPAQCCVSDKGQRGRAAEEKVFTASSALFSADARASPAQTLSC